MNSEQYRKKPVVIEAWQWHGSEDDRGVCARCPMSDKQKLFGAHLHTAHQGQMVALIIGDWIIPEPDGIHYYPCKPDIFEQTYEKVSVPSPSLTEMVEKAVRQISAASSGGGRTLSNWTADMKTVCTDLAHSAYSLGKSEMEKEKEILRQRNNELAQTMGEMVEEIARLGSALQSERERAEAAIEYVQFLEKFWGIPERITRNPQTTIAREKYLSALTTQEGK